MRVGDLASVELTIKVENAYSDGYESGQTHVVRVPRFGAEEDLWDELYVYTGDGHGVGRDLDAYYVVTITAAPECPELVGASNEWG